MVLLARIDHPVRLQLVKDALRGRGIEPVIESEGVQGLLPGLSLFAARVLVADEDLDAARRVLRDLGLEREMDR